MHALIDADSIIFRCGFAVEHTKYKWFIKGEEHNGPFQIYDYKKDIPEEFYHDEEICCQTEKEVEPLSNALYLVKQELEGILEATGADSYQVYIKGKGNFRDALSVTRKYKGNRDVAHRPTYEKGIREYLISNWDAIEVDGQEADDAITIEHSRWDGETIICSIDKDFNQVPGWHYNFAKKDKYWITEEEATRNFYVQLLVGDVADNIQGVPGIGKAKANKLLANCGSAQDMYEICHTVYLTHYLDKGEETLNEMAQLLYLRRKEGEAWKPPV